MRPDMRDFDPATATAEEILFAARWLVGKTVAETDFSDPSALEQPSSAHNKGAVGRVYEEYFNISQNSDPRPDFIDAGIELKSTGVYLDGDGETRQKERLSLRMMGTFDPAEEWPTSSLSNRSSTTCSSSTTATEPGTRSGRSRRSGSCTGYRARTS